MSFADAMAETDAIYRARTIAATFGHLAPKPATVYSGQVLFAHGEYHDMCVIKSTIDVEDSPWFFQDLQDFFWKTRMLGTRIREGRVYRFTGTYRKLKNGKGRFAGKVERVA